MNAGSDGSKPRSRGRDGAVMRTRPTASTTRSMSRSRSIVDPDLGVGRPAGQALAVGDGPAAGVRAGRLDVDRGAAATRRDPARRARRPRPRRGSAARPSRSDRDGGSAKKRIRSAKTRPGRVPRPSSRAMSGGQDERLVGDVEAGHPDRDRRLEDDRRGLRVGPDVELGGRRSCCPRRASRPSARSPRSARRGRARRAAAGRRS